MRRRSSSEQPRRVLARATGEPPPPIPAAELASEAGYVSCLFASQLHAIDLATETVTHRAQLGASPKSIAVSDDGRYVYSADYGTTRSVSVVDTASWSAQTFIVPGMDRGSGIVVGPGGHHAFVTGWYDAHLYRVGFEGTGGHPETAREKTARWLHRPFSRDPGDGQ